MYWTVVAFFEMETAQSPTAREMMSFNCARLLAMVPSVAEEEAARRKGRTNHVKGIGHQSERVHGKAGAQLNAKEDDVDGEHHLDARRLGPTHPGELCGHGRRRTGETQEMEWQKCRCLGVSSWGCGCGCRAQRERRSWRVVLVELKMGDDEDEIINQSAAWLRLAWLAAPEFDIPIKKGRSNPNRTTTTFPPLSTLHLGNLPSEPSRDRRVPSDKSLFHSNTNRS